MAASGEKKVVPAEYSAYRSQTLKDYHVILEYKNLQKKCPQGVYVLPSTGSMRVWHGVVFVRGALYKNGIFKFRIDIPKAYPSNGVRPFVTFHTNVFHPMIDPAVSASTHHCIIIA